MILIYLEVLFRYELHFFGSMTEAETGPVSLVSKDRSVANDIRNVILAWPRLVDVGP